MEMTFDIMEWSTIWIMKQFKPIWESDNPKVGAAHP